MAQPSVVVRMDQSAINKMLKQSGGNVNRMMMRLAKIAKESVQQVSDQRITHRTGNYRRSIDATIVDPTTIEVGAYVRYAAVLEHGSKPHQILPLRGKVLAFESGGQMVFTRRVMHPGTQARNIVRDGVALAGTRVRGE